MTLATIGACMDRDLAAAAGPTPAPQMQMFNVSGVKRHGVIIDPGAASGLTGTQTLKELFEATGKRHGDQLTFSPTQATFTGVDGRTDAGLAICEILLRF